MGKGMTASSQKETKCIFRIEEDLLKKYKSICEEKGYDMSKRLRLFIENELKEPVYDYDKKIEKIKENSVKKVKSLSLLYFAEKSEVRQHEFFKLKEEEFILTLSNLYFLFESSKKTFSNLSNNYYISNYYEIIIDITINMIQIIKNIKNYLEEIENFFIKIKKDL